MSEMYGEMSSAWEDDRADELEQSAEDALPAASFSRLCDFEVSPLHCWYNHIRPDREEPEATPAQQFGTALHHLVFQPDLFPQLYCERFVPPEDALVTVADLRAYIADTGNKAQGTRKAEIIEQVQTLSPDVPIADVLETEYNELHGKKTQFSAEDWAKLFGAAQTIQNEPVLVPILAKQVEPEQRLVAPYRGIHLRGILDWATPEETVDLKSITTRGDEPFERSVFRAIWNRRYHWQAYIYAILRSPKNPQKAPASLFAFVESEPPHQTRICRISPLELGEVNLLWEDARIRVDAAVDLYRQYLDHFGANDKPWRYAAEIDELGVEDFPQLAWTHR